MGATDLMFLEEGTSITEIYSELVEDADVEYGIGLYNGSINTCSLGRCKMRFDKFTKTNLKKAEKYVEEQDYGTKNEINYIDLGIVGWDITEVKKNVKKANPKYKNQYVAKDVENNEMKSFDTKTLADNYAMKQTLKGKGTYIVTKEPILVEGSSVVTEVTKTTRRHKSVTRPKLKQQEMRKVRPVHKYLLYGMASI